MKNICLLLFFHPTVSFTYCYYANGGESFCFYYDKCLFGYDFRACLKWWRRAEAEVNQLDVVIGRERQRQRERQSGLTPGWPVLLQELSESPPRERGRRAMLVSCQGPCWATDSGPSTRSHVRPSVPPPCSVPSPSLHSTTLHCQTRLGP